MKWMLALVLATALPLSAQELTVAAAADLRPALEELSSRFQTQSSVKIHTIYGSSGDLFHQIENGAPFDVFLSANVAYPRKLESANQIVSGSYYEYARGKIVLIVRAASRLDVTRGLNILLDPSVRKVAIADPEHAPYGRAAVKALKAEKLYDKLSPKIVTGENISQTASFVLSGAADAGIVALSLVIAPPTSTQVRYAEIPAADYAPILQACVVLRSSKRQSDAVKFGSYLKSEEAVGILRRFGFELPATP